MIDYLNQVFNAVYNAVTSEYGDIDIKGEYVNTPSSFPCVTFDELSNVSSNLDNGEIKFTDVQYRVQVFSNKANGKRGEARAIFKTIEECLYGLNLTCKTFTTTPTIYNSNVYEIQATFEGTISSNGVIYRR